MGSLPLWKGSTMRMIRIQNNQWSLKHCSVLCIVQFAAPFAQKCDHLPPPPLDPYISETAFSHRFQKVYTSPPPPQRDEVLAHSTKSSQNAGKVPKPTVLAHTECPQEIRRLFSISPLLFSKLVSAVRQCSAVGLYAAPERVALSVGV